MNSFVLIAGAGFAAGAMNALAGGGSFLTLPAMIAAGLPSVQANASNTVALYPASLASAWAYREGLGPVGTVSLRTMLIITLIGGALGAILLLRTPTHVFDVMLPWLLLIATVTLAVGRQAGELMRRYWHMGSIWVLGIQFGLGIYGGYFGGAIGIMMVAVWGLLGHTDVKKLHAPRTLLVSAANTMAVIIFIAAHEIYWAQTLVMLVAATIGAYGGAQLGRRAPPTVVRAGTLMISTCITVLFFVRTYWH